MKITVTILSLILLIQSIAAQKTFVPIAELKLKGLLGGVQNGKWINAKLAGAKLLKTNEFTLIGLNGVEEGAATTAARGESDDVCQDFVPLKFELNRDSGAAIGAGAKWNFVPRAAQTIDVKNPVYVKEVAAFLLSKGIAKPQVKITRALRVDLDGDGQNEVVIAATRYGAQFTKINSGDYSFVMVRKIVGGKVQNLLVSGEFYTKKSEFAAPNRHEISAIADLNGDGAMEILIYGEYYEGSWAELYEWKAGKFAKVLEAGCGV